MLAYLQLLRPGNVILVGIAVFVGAFVAVGREVVDYQNDLKIAILCSMMLVGGGNALNDYNDRKTDGKNHPNRPLPSGKISEENAILYAKGLLLGGLLILVSKLDDSTPFAIALGGVVLLLMYEKTLKATGFAGNVVIGILSGAVFLYAGEVVGHSEKTVWIFGLAALASITSFTRTYEMVLSSLLQLLSNFFVHIIFSLNKPKILVTRAEVINKYLLIKTSL
mgnify:CR=1 FL=1